MPRVKKNHPCVRMNLYMPEKTREKLRELQVLLGANSESEAIRTAVGMAYEVQKRIKQGAEIKVVEKDGTVYGVVFI